jgi:hypothetical protein
MEGYLVRVMEERSGRAVALPDNTSVLFPLIFNQNRGKNLLACAITVSFEPKTILDGSLVYQ